jgi:hypothetical protein
VPNYVNAEGFFGYLPNANVVQKTKTKQLTYLFTHDLSETLAALMNQPHGSTSIHMRKKIKRRKKKSLDGLGSVGETHALKLENEVFISIVYDDTPPLEKTCKVLMSLTQKRHKQ